MSPSASVIIYAYGDRFLEDHPRRRGMKLPCREERVNKRGLAAMAVVGALLGLADGGHVRLSIGERRALMGLRKRPAALAELIDAPRSSTGLERQLLESMADDREATDVRKILERMLPRDGDPWGNVLGLIEEDMLAQGYFAVGERGAVATAFLGEKLEPDCQRITALADCVSPTVDLLDRFRRANPGLYEQLVQDAQKGIRARQEADYD